MILTCFINIIELILIIIGISIGIGGLLTLISIYLDKFDKLTARFEEKYLNKSWLKTFFNITTMIFHVLMLITLVMLIFYYICYV